MPPSGAAYARLTLVRRSDGKLFSAPGTWRDAEGNEVQGPEFISSSPSKSSAVVDPEGDPAPTAGDVPRDGGADGAARATETDRPPEEREEEEQPKEKERTP
jgi:hypothetical protein